MIITKVSAITGVTHTRDVPITLKEYSDWVSTNELVQYAFPNLSSDDREFLLTGSTPEEWDSLFNEDDSLEDK